MTLKSVLKFIAWTIVGVVIPVIILQHYRNNEWVVIVCVSVANNLGYREGTYSKETF